MKSAGGSGYEGITCQSPSPSSAKHRKRRKSDEVRSALLVAARNLFEASGYPGATTREIARQGGTTEAVLFRHFGSKAKLFEAAIVEPFTRLFDGYFAEEDGTAKGDDPRDRRKYVQRMINLLNDNRRLLMAMITAYAYEGHLDQAPSLETFFAAAFERVRRNVLAYHIWQSDPALMDMLMRYGFVSVVGALLLEEWVFPKGFTSDSSRTAQLTRFIDLGMYGVPPTPLPDP